MMRILKILLIIPIITLLSCSFFNRAPKTYKPEMVFIEGGSFEIGDVFEQSNSDAIPTHQVTVDPFYLSKYEITFEQYDDYAVKNRKALPDDNNYGRDKRAVVNITWDEANAFCKKLGMRLPSEIEWEYAARSGGKHQMFAGTNDPDSLRDFAIVRSMNINFSFIVGSKKPNDLGLYDMSGNVFEWIDEFYQIYSFPGLLHDHKKDGIRLIRGGSFAEETMATRTYWRVGTLHDVRATDIGFRCAKSK